MIQDLKKYTIYLVINVDGKDIKHYITQTDDLETAIYLKTRLSKMHPYCSYIIGCRFKKRELK